MSDSYPFYPILPLFSNVGFALCKFQIRGIWRINTSYIFCKQLGLDLKPFFLLRKLIESSCDLLRCHCCGTCLHGLCYLLTRLLILTLLLFPSYPDFLFLSL